MSAGVSVAEAPHVNTPIGRVARLGARCGWISAVAWIAVGIDSIIRPIQDNRRDIVWWIPFVFMIPAIVAVHRVQCSPEKRLERYTYYAVMFASLLVLLGNLGTVFNVPTLAKLGFPAGALVWIVGLGVFGWEHGEPRFCRGIRLWP